jgi:3-hydroxyisobutyrate dehydrogenase-like beta-hydroxyacid dehydrogenase
MGISIAASARNSGHAVYWISEGRSAQSRSRAAEQRLIDAGTMADLCETCSILVCVCPPHAAEDVAHAVCKTGFSGLYVDANAISPQRATRIAQEVKGAGASFVDGSIVGPPAWEPDRTWLHLSGPRADEIPACFDAGPLQTNVIDDTIGKASALKMCYAAYTKGSTALLCAILGTAEELGVRANLQQQWARDGSGLDTQAPERACNVTAKAWRFVGEMDEIASTLQWAGLPGGFHLAAADIYRRIADFKDAPATPPLEDVLDALIGRTSRA